MGIAADYIVPDRFKLGYGLTPEIVDMCAERAPKPDLIITVDNGIASIEGVAHAKTLGIDVLVTDHHLPADVLPEAACIVNPNVKTSTFPSKSLAGCGVMYYVLLALRAELRRGSVASAGALPPRAFPRFLPSRAATGRRLRRATLPLRSPRASTPQGASRKWVSVLNVF